MSTSQSDPAAPGREAPVILPLLLVVLVLGGAADRLAVSNEETLMKAERLVESRIQTILGFPQQFALGGRSITRTRLEDIRDRGFLSGPEFLFESSWRRREDGVRTRAAIALVVLAAVQGDIAGLPRDLAGLKHRRKTTGGELTDEEKRLVMQSRVILSGLRGVPGREAREELLSLYRAGLVARVLPTEFMAPAALEAFVREELGWGEDVEAVGPEAGPEIEPEPEPEPEPAESPSTTELVLPEVQEPWEAGDLELLPRLEPVSLQLEPPTTAP